METQNIIPEAYVGREQALIKHYMLEKYLEKLTAILSVNRKIFEFTYVDCFAGPWQASAEQMSSTSIAISLKVLEKCKITLESQGRQTNIRALFLEQNGTAYPALKQYLDAHTPSGIQTHSIHGEFVESRDKILNWVGKSGDAFFFIDPKGWTEVKVDTLAPLLRRPRSEFVINFMYDFINRTASMERHAPEMEELFGESVAKNIGENREKYLLDVYRKNIKKQIVTTNNGYKARSAFVTVLDPQKRRTKYHLVYVTTHPKGVIKFMETYEGADVFQSEVRAKLRDDRKAERTGTVDMFDTEPRFIDNSTFKSNESKIDQFWLKYIGIERVVDEYGFADILEATNWFPGELQASLSRLISQKKIQNLDAPKPRPKRPLHFEEKNGERLRAL